MTVSELDTPLVEGGIDNVNFFNGRILAAEDLRQLQAADREHRRRLGQALGPGVAGGLRVTRAASGAPGVLAVSSGAAINRLGELGVLSADAEVRVTGAAPARTPSGMLFAECGQSDSAPVANLEFATMLLTVRPDSQSRGSAPATDPLGRGISCGPGNEREGVRFRRVAVDLVELIEATGGSAMLALNSPANRSLTRSLLAHLHLGSPWLPPLLYDSFDTEDQTGFAFEALHDCEVPLALFVVRNGEVAVLDEWAVRRRLAAPADADPMAFLVGAQRRRTGEATLLQFQAQLAEELARTKTLVLKQLLFYLPAAGLLPALEELLNKLKLEDLAGRQLPCFAGIPHTVIDEALPPALVEHALRVGTEMPAIDLTASPVPSVLVFGVSEPQPTAPLQQVLFARIDHPLAERALRRVTERKLVAIERRLDGLAEQGKPTLMIIYRGPQSSEITPNVELTMPWDVFASRDGKLKLTATAAAEGGYYALRSEITAEIAGATEITVTGGKPVRVNVKVLLREREVISPIEVDEIFVGTIVIGENAIVEVGDIREGGPVGPPGPAPFERAAPSAAGAAGGGRTFTTSGRKKEISAGGVLYLRRYQVTLAAQSIEGPTVSDTKTEVLTVS